MYTILLNESKELTVTHREAIIQYSNLVDTLRFLVAPVIGENDMAEFETVMLEYITPISRELRTEMLVRSEENYKDYLQYLLPVDTKITKEFGDISMQLSFYRSEMLESGEVTTPVFKTRSCVIKVIPLENWQQYIRSADLAAMDQLISKLTVLQTQIDTEHEQVMNIIDDENISDDTTWSSRKISDVYLDNDEVVSIEGDRIDDLFDNADVSGNIPPGSVPISSDEIQDLFTGSNDSNGSEDASGDEVDGDAISGEMINALFI